MSGGRDHEPLNDVCISCRGAFQDYLDGVLPKKRSLEIFLHLRDCEACRQELAELESLFEMLGSLPAAEVPADFDARVLASVPYEAYRAMEPLRRERVPVYLEEEFLPAPVRAVGTRAGGIALAALAAVGLGASWLPDWTVAIAVVGVLPELLVRLQRLARRASLADQRSESG
jgi:anti-sigma factor RsiW